MRSGHMQLVGGQKTAQQAFVKPAGMRSGPNLFAGVAGPCVVTIGMVVEKRVHRRQSDGDKQDHHQ